MAQVIIDVDPHKRSATIEIINVPEKTVGQGRFSTDRDGYKANARRRPQAQGRLWAVEGCNGIGRHVAQRLVADGETVVDVPAKLSARARVFATGQGRKTDPSTPAASPWSPCAPKVCGRSSPTTPRSRYGCWSTAVTSSAGRPLRLVERHRADRRLVRRPEPAPPLQSREPAHQPGAAHHGHRPVAP